MASGPTQPRRPTTWVDITDIAHWQGPPTGIQRVVHEWGLRVLQAPGPTKCCRFDPVLGTFITAHEATLRDPFKVSDKPNPTQPDGAAAPSIAGPTRQSRLARLPYRLGIRLGIRLQNRLQNRLRTGPPDATPDTLFAPGDRLVIIGANWLTHGYAHHLERLAIDQTLEITQVVYDLIPSMYPQWAATGAASIVTPFLVQVLPLCKHIICISQNTRNDIQQFVVAHNIALRSDVRIEVVPLGTAMRTTSTARTATPPQEINPSDPFVLCVGTLEVRKNQIVLYQAYCEAAQQGIKLPKLYCVGRIGWLAESTEHAIRHDPAVNSHIQILESVHDDQLEWLYQHCLMTFYPSLYEGWGLPVAESLAHGKICITTRQASLPEVGGELVDYASPFCSNEWLDALAKYLDPVSRSTRESEIRVGYQQRSWDTSGEEFCIAIRVTDETPSP